MSSRRSSLAVSFLGSILALAACDGGGFGRSDTGIGPTPDAYVPPGTDAAVGDIDAYAPPGTDAYVSPGGVTYYGQLRPVIYENCIQCHTTGGVAPFPLETYEQTTAFGSRLVEVTRDRIMPPYLADNSGACQDFRDARWLSDAEIGTFAAWYAGGMLEGDPSTPRPEIVPPPTLTGSVTTLDIGVDYAPDASGTDDYRCFLVDSPSGYVTGYDVHPGNTATVHHVIVYEPTSDAEGDDARAQDAAEPGPGYTCFGGAGVGAFPVVLWAPGGGATTFPRGTGIQIEASRPLVVQIHYNLLGGSGTDRTRVDIQTTSRATPAYMVPMVDQGFSIPPRMMSFTSSDEQSLGGFGLPAGLSIRAYGSFPHMHTMGTSLRVDILRGGGAEECAIQVPRWDFNWQLAYWYETPIRVSSADSVRITCEWNSMSRDTSTTWGEGTQDEMCLNFFYISL